MDECNEKDRYNLGPGFSGFNSYYNEKMKSIGESKIVCQVSKDKIKKE